jgi:hypothetical protein
MLYLQGPVTNLQLMTSAITLFRLGVLLLPEKHWVFKVPKPHSQDLPG